MLPPEYQGTSMLRIHLNQPKVTFEQRLAKQALLIKEQIKSLPQGRERELLSRKARQLETASHIAEWMSSPGLRPPV
jgi:Fe-S cluster biosynthesis and repair protein YggX